VICQVDYFRDFVFRLFICYPKKEDHTGNCYYAYVRTKYVQNPFLLRNNMYNCESKAKAKFIHIWSLLWTFRTKNGTARRRLRLRMGFFFLTNREVFFVWDPWVFFPRKSRGFFLMYVWEYETLAYFFSHIWMWVFFK